MFNRVSRTGSRNRRFRWALLAASLCLSSIALAQQLKDPMRPAGLSSSGTRNAIVRARNYRLSSTFIARGHKSAIVNGRRIQVGDMIGNARVVEILPTEIRLRRDGRTTMLRLLPITVKTPALTE